jgi:hypothetical protein
VEKEDPHVKQQQRIAFEKSSETVSFVGNRGWIGNSDSFTDSATVMAAAPVSFLISFIPVTFSIPLYLQLYRIGASIPMRRTVGKYAQAMGPFWDFHGFRAAFNSYGALCDFIAAAT